MSNGDNRDCLNFTHSTKPVSKAKAKEILIEHILKYESHCTEEEKAEFLLEVAARIFPSSVLIKSELKTLAYQNGEEKKIIEI